MSPSLCLDYRLASDTTSKQYMLIAIRTRISGKAAVAARQYGVRGKLRKRVVHPSFAGTVEQLTHMAIGADKVDVLFSVAPDIAVTLLRGAGKLGCERVYEQKQEIRMPRAHFRRTTR